MDTSTALIDAVRRNGADAVFGVPGGGPNLEVIGAAEAAGLRFVLMHGETAAAIAAGTYGLLHGRPAMAIATRGPGAASAVNGAAQATLDRFPLLLVTDCVPAHEMSRVAHQRLDQVALMSPVTKWSGRIGGPNSTAIAERALAIAAAAPAGAVHLDFDPQFDPQFDPGPDGFSPLALGETGGIDADLLATAQTMLAGAERPVVIVGIGALASAPKVLDAVERLGCPVLTTYQAIGLLPDGHPQFAGLYTSGAIERPLLDQADLVLAIGLDTVEPMPTPWAAQVPVITLDEHEPASAFLPATVALVGPVAELAVQLAPGTPGTSTQGWSPTAGAEAHAVARAALTACADGAFGPIELATTVARLAPANATATVDAGAHFLSIMPFWPARAPLDLLISNGLATMGFAVPAAIGAALARPDRPVVCMVGDGGLGMTLAELETIARLRLPITVVVFDDAALSLIEIKQRPGQGGSSAVRYAPVDFAGVAAAMGLSSAAVETVPALERELAGGWDRPRLIDARIDRGAYRALITATRG